MKHHVENVTEDAVIDGQGDIGTFGGFLKENLEKEVTRDIRVAAEGIPAGVALVKNGKKGGEGGLECFIRDGIARVDALLFRGSEDGEEVVVGYFGAALFCRSGCG